MTTPRPLGGHPATDAQATPPTRERAQSPGSRSARGKPSFRLVWFWRPKPFPGRTVDRKGQRCRVFARAAMGSVGVEFEDGFKVVTSRYAVREVAR